LLPLIIHPGNWWTGIPLSYSPHKSGNVHVIP